MLSVRSAAGAGVAVLVTASLAVACGVTLQPTITPSAAAALSGRSDAPLILRLAGVTGGGLVRIYVADASGNYVGTSDPRFVAYGALEASASPRSATVIVSGVAALRKASKSGNIELRLIADHGNVAVTGAVLDTGS
jgi:hypothetical protein